MIQRVQSIYLVLALICMALLAYFSLFSITVSFATEYGPFSYYSELGPDGFTGDEMSDAQFPIYLVYMSLASLTLICLFLFKRRKLQLNFCRLNLVLHLLLVIAFYAVYYGGRFMLMDLLDIEPTDEVTIEFKMMIGFYLIVATIPLLLLAIRGIKKDEKLVKSLDRLR